MITKIIELLAQMGMTYGADGVNVIGHDTVEHVINDASLPARIITPYTIEATAAPLTGGTPTIGASAVIRDVLLIQGTGQGSGVSEHARNVAYYIDNYIYAIRKQMSGLPNGIAITAVSVQYGVTDYMGKSYLSIESQLTYRGLYG